MINCAFLSYCANGEPNQYFLHIGNANMTHNLSESNKKKQDEEKEAEEGEKNH